ncbi:hypothetical protein RTBOTA2_006648 [Rhodotorula toruloides]|nr:hypothetical protein RTBOTA2_006648 [Rhodotorula toruloides]
MKCRAEKRATSPGVHILCGTWLEPSDVFLVSLCDSSTSLLSSRRSVRLDESVMRGEGRRETNFDSGGLRGAATTSVCSKSRPPKICFELLRRASRSTWSTRLLDAGEPQWARLRRHSAAKITLNGLIAGPSPRRQVPVSALSTLVRQDHPSYEPYTPSTEFIPPFSPDFGLISTTWGLSKARMGLGTGLCECGEAVETRQHYILECSLYTDKRQQLRREIGTLNLKMDKIFSPRFFRPLLHFILASYCFPQLYAPLPLVAPVASGGSPS